MVWAVLLFVLAGLVVWRIVCCVRGLDCLNHMTDWDDGPSERLGPSERRPTERRKERAD